MIVLVAVSTGSLVVTVEVMVTVKTSVVVQVGRGIGYLASQKLWPLRRLTKAITHCKALSHRLLPWQVRPGAAELQESRSNIERE